MLGRLYGIDRARFFVAVIVAVACALTGCVGTRATKPKIGVKTEAAREPGQILWPAPPDQPRFKFVGILSTSKDFVQESDSELLKRTLTGQPGSADRPVTYKPSGIAVRAGLVYVAEPTVRAVTVFDLERRKLFRFGTREPNALKKPQAIAVDRNGLVYVLDSSLHKVMVFDELGLFLRAIAIGKGYTNPVSVAVSPDGAVVYVVDRGDLDNADHKVVAYSTDGAEKFRLGPRGSGEGQFNIPLAAAVSTDGTLYVVDTGNFRIQAFDGNGRFRLEFGGPGITAGSFSRPRSIAVDAGGNIYVGDAGFNNVQIFNPKGEILMPLGRLNRNPGPGNYGLLAGIAVDEEGRLFINDHYFKKIDVFVALSEQEGQQLAANPQ